MLDVIALDVAAETATETNNALGTTMPKHYHHLYDKAGEHSRSPAIRRGVTTMWSHPYSAHVAEPKVRLSDMIFRSAERLANSVEEEKYRVRNILHTQATLDQQIVGSTCLRLEEDVFQTSEETATIGQCGTAGFGTALMLAPMLSALQDSSRGLVAITAGDKWIAPFQRKLGCFQYGDAAGSVLVGKDETQPIGRIDCVKTHVFAPLTDLWNVNEEMCATYVFDHALSICQEVLNTPAKNSQSNDQPEYLCGDITSGGVAERLATEINIALLQDESCLDGGSDDSQPAPLNTSSASCLVAMDACLKRAAAINREVRALIWSVSPSGNATAFIFTALPSNFTKQGVWT